MDYKTFELLMIAVISKTRITEHYGTCSRNIAGVQSNSASHIIHALISDNDQLTQHKDTRERDAFFRKVAVRCGVGI